MTTCAERVDKLMKTVELFDSTFPNHLCKSGYLTGILIELSCESEELYLSIDNKLRGLILWKTMVDLEEFPLVDREEDQKNCLTTEQT
jgi:hypothetical protein